MSKRLGLLLCGMVACGTPSQPPPVEPPPAPEPPPVFDVDEELQGVRLSLSTVEPTPTGPTGAPGPAPKPPPPPQPLSDRDVSALLARAPQLQADPDDAVSFQLPADSPPPPRAGGDLQARFPPLPDQAPDVDPSPVKVVRYAPEGEVPLAPRVSITFDQPMVALTSHDHAATTIPATLEPQPEGEWRWLGTRTLVFDPVERLPMATEYTVTVPAGTKAASGQALDEALSFRFATPGPELVAGWPDDVESQPLSPVITLQFDQAMDPDVVQEHVRFMGSGAPALRLATAAEIDGDEDPYWVGDTPPERLVQLVPEEPLAMGTRYQVVLPVGLAGAEGPRTTRKAHRLSFRTYGQLKVTGQECGWGGICRPSMPWYVNLSNPLDPEQDLSGVKVTPEVPGLQVTVGYDMLQFSGRFEARTRYTVTVPAGLTDTFGQQLGSDVTRRFSVGAAERMFDPSGRSFVVLDPNGGGSWPVFSTNHTSMKVTVHRVEPSDWTQWRTMRDRYRYDDVQLSAMPGERVVSSRVAIDGPADEIVESAVELGPHLNEGFGQFVAVLTPSPPNPDAYDGGHESAFVQVTRLGLHTFVDHDEALTWVTDLATGEPLEGVEVTLEPAGTVATTDADGLVRMDLVSGESELVVARRGADTALLPAQPEYGYGGWQTVGNTRGLRWYVTDDRGLYQPGETAHVKGWIRSFGRGDDARLGAAPDDQVLAWTWTGAHGNELDKGEVSLSSAGGFDLELEVPANANLGHTSLTLFLGGQVHHHAVQVQEFRRPELEVTASSNKDRLILGERATVTLDAHYYTGGPVPDSPVRWTVYASSASWQPPGHDRFQFGGWSPRWWSWHAPADDEGGPWTHEGRTDAAGLQRLGLHVEAMGPPRARTLRVEGQVEDVNRQAWTASSTLLVHPASVAVGLRTERTFVDPGDEVELSLIVVDLEGEIQANTAVEVVFEKMVGWPEEAKAIDRCEATTDDEGMAACTFEPEAGGVYRFRAEAHDGRGRPTTSDLRMWVSGAEQAPSRSVELENVLLIPESDELGPGDTARVLVVAPFAPSEAMITWRRDGVVHTEQRHLESTSTTIEVPLTDAHVPDLTVQIDLAGRAVRTDDDGKPLADVPQRVAHATGQLQLNVSPRERTLAVELEAPDAVAPGRDAEVTVRVVDAAGEPVADAEVVLAVVDEAVLVLSGHELPDPMEVFYRPVGAGVWDLRLRQWVALSNPESASEVAALGPVPKPRPSPRPIPTGGATGGLLDAGLREQGGEGRGRMLRAKDKSPDMDMVPMEEAEPAMLDQFGYADEKNQRQATQAPGVAVRDDFAATAVFAPAVRTNGRGEATVSFAMPDSLTRYRVMAVAAHGDRHFGRGDASITARLPLMVRPSLPRFLNSGDQAELPVVVQNQTDAPLDVSLGMAVTRLALVDAVAPTAPTSGKPQGGYQITVPAQDRVEVRFPVITEGAGTARVQVVAAAGGLQDAAAIELPVNTPATSEAFATTGSVTDAPFQVPVEVPDDVWPQYGGLEVTTSSTQLQALTDAFVYLSTYPYECNEQLASRLIAVAALRDVLEAFDAEGLPEPAALEKQVTDDLARLARRQNYDGGFAFWRRGDPAWPYLSIHVALAYAEARKAGYEVDSAAWNRSLNHLRSIERYIPGWYDAQSRRYLKAFALDVRRRMGDSDPGKARGVLAELSVERHELEVLGFLLPTLHEANASQVPRILKHLNQQVTETTSGAHFVTGTSDGAHVLLHSSRRADGILLRALLEVAPDDELLEKVTRDLLAHRVKGRWSSTQENAFVLLGLRAYFDVREKETPDFIAKVWLGDALLGEHPFTERSTERFHMDVPLAAVEDGPITVLREGDQGRLYYRLAMRYAPASLDLAPADRGFAVERTYEAVDDPEDVQRRDDGSWWIRAGATVKVKVSMVAESRRYHVALVDALPAGLEASNPALATTGTLPPEDPTAMGGGGLWWWWSRTWYEHENLRDDRAEAFTSLLWPGVHEYSYIARATTPGRFVVPPARAEEMYAPETFGRSGTDRVVIE